MSERGIGADPVVGTLGVALFSEVYHPVSNGIVASIDVLRGGLGAFGYRPVVVVPVAPASLPVDGVVRLRSWPLPTDTGYRLIVPLLGAGVRARLGRLAVVHTHSVFVSGILGRRLAARERLPHVYTYHTRLAAYAHYARPLPPGLARSALAALVRAHVQTADAVIVPTAVMARELRESGVGGRIEVVPTGVAVERFAAARALPEVRRRLGAGDGTILALTVARLGKEKNVSLVLRALAASNELRFRLAVAGDGPELPHLEREALQLGIGDRVQFLGEVDRADLPGLYAAADVFVFPSATETQGLVLVEALAAGLPIAAVDCGVTREVLGEFGLFAPPHPAALAAARSQAVEHPFRDAKQMALERYTLEAQLRRTDAIYRELCAGKA